MTSWSPTGFASHLTRKALYLRHRLYRRADEPVAYRVFDVDHAAGKLSNSKVFAEMPKPSITDGLRCDTRRASLVLVGWGDPNEDGVRCYTPDGDLLGKVHIPETVANLCFGGQQRNRLYICGSSSLYASTRVCRAP
jgi:gluconolactonase